MRKTIHIFLGCYFTALIFLFYYSGRNVPVRIWDEAIYANNALEMAQTHEYFVLQNNGAPSLYNTKPPLAIWMQSLSMELFGINELAIRLPSILAVLGIILSLLFFIRRHFANSAGAAFICGSVLLSSSGFMRDHVAATGDLDALLCL